MTEVFQSFEHWRHDLDDDDQDLTQHLARMSKGDEGHFSRALYRALDVADGSNMRRLYEAFPELFNPAF